MMMDERDWSFLLSGADVVSFQRDDVIIQEGDEFKYFYKLKTGQVRVEKASSPSLLSLSLSLSLFSLSLLLSSLLFLITSFFSFPDASG
jgi:CRP-like cAMP-binding protein